MLLSPGQVLSRHVEPPRYFLSMLNDTDRNTAFEVAIGAAIADFRHATGRAPRVLDLGAGAGMLSLIALKHGAGFVTSIESNGDLINVLHSNLRRLDPRGKRSEVYRGMSTGFVQGECAV